MTDETSATTEEWDGYLQAASDLGRERGTADGSWVFDGNSDYGTVRRVLTMIEDGDPAWEIPAPLSGEWADGYSLSRLSDDLGVDQEDDGFNDLCDLFEDAYYQAFESEVVRSGKAMLP